MLINNKPAADTTESILEQLQELPSSFPYYVSTPWNVGIPISEQKLYKEAYALYLQAKALEQDSLQSAFYSEVNWSEVSKKIELKLLESEKKAESDSVLNGYINKSLGEMYSTYDFEDGLNKSRDRYEQCLEIFLKNKRYFNLEGPCKSLVGIYEKNNKIEELIQKQNKILSEMQSSNNKDEELKSRLILGAAYAAQNEDEKAIEHYARAYSLKQGYVDYDAIRVEQREVGFSNQEKIGTDNILQCVAVIIHDPNTKKTALAHIDYPTDIQSLTEDVVNKFEATPKLNAYLIGAGDYITNKGKIANDNINKVIEELNKHSSINIITANVGSKNYPLGIVFDPLKGELKHAVPGKVDESTSIRQALIHLSKEENPKLHIAFDLTKSKEIPIPAVSKEIRQEIEEKYKELHSHSAYRDEDGARHIDAARSNQEHLPMIKAFNLISSKPQNLDEIELLGQQLSKAISSSKDIESLQAVRHKKQTSTKKNQILK